MNGSICITAYFSFFGDVVSSWHDASEKSIYPGIQLAEELSMESNNKRKTTRLEKWLLGATKNIKQTYELVCLPCSTHTIYRR